MINKNSLGGTPVGRVVEGWVLLTSIKILQSTNNNNYLAWEGFDIQGSRIFGTYFGDGQRDNKVLPNYTEGMVISVAGSFGQGRTGQGLWASRMSQVQDEKDIEEFKSYCYPSVPKDQLTKIISDLKKYSESISDPELLKLAIKMFEYYEPYLWVLPAGRSVHEPIRGGLAKHTSEVLAVVNNSLFLGKSPNKEMNRDVLIFSALYHDIGKTHEYTSDLGITDNFRLIPHTFIAAQLLTSVIQKNAINVDRELLRHVKHCLASHHGEFAEVRPATREAVVLHYTDMMVSKIGHIEELSRSKAIGSDGWGKFSTVLETSPYVPELDERKDAAKI